VNEEQLEELINSYGLVRLLEDIDLEPVQVLIQLIELGIVDDNKLREVFYE
jgi:hypothetical protein